MQHQKAILGRDCKSEAQPLEMHHLLFHSPHFLIWAKETDVFYIKKKKQTTVALWSLWSRALAVSFRVLYVHPHLNFCCLLCLPRVYQCEVRLAQKRGRLESSLSGGASEDEEGDDGGESDSDEESSAKARYFGYIKQGLYYVTEMERFAPPRKRPRTVLKNYRLVSLRSTTPEELYQRKVRRLTRRGNNRTFSQ